MISIPLIAVATALVVCAITAKVVGAAPKKASKSQKAEIMKRLLALSDGDTKTSGTTAVVRLRSNQAKFPSNGAQNTTAVISKPMRTQITSARRG